MSQKRRLYQHWKGSFIRECIIMVVPTGNGTLPLSQWKQGNYPVIPIYVWGKRLTAQMWALYINRNHPLSDYPLVDAVMLHHAVSYDWNPQNLDLSEKVNDEGVYHHFLTGNNMSTLHFYQVCKKGGVSNDHKLKTGCFWSKRHYNPFT